MNMHLAKPFDADAYCKNAAERRRRLMSPPNRRTASPASAKPVLVSSQPEEKRATKRLPVWQWGAMEFDEHVKDWREQMISPCKSHMRRRCEDLGITMQDLSGPKRTHPLVDHRQLIMWELKTIVKPEITYPELGRLFGGRDHTTGLHAVRKIGALKDKGLLP